VKPRGLVIAIDGPSGAGKSTAGRALAALLGYTFIDTGAMYRALAVKAARASADPDDAETLAALLHDARIELQDAGRRVLLDGEDVSEAIRTREASALASRVSVHPAVRREMVARQRALGEQGGVVLDGRDIGTAVFPDAEVKFYLDADPRQRARRRQSELAAAGGGADLAAIEGEIRERDHADASRADSPLVRAAGAIRLDTTAFTPDQVVERMLDAVRSTAEASRTRRRS
jgi:cytidylate kinase